MPKRLRAVDVCRKEKWDKGTLLMSDSWTYPKRIHLIDEVQVILYLGTEARAYQDAKTFPADIRKIG